MERDPKNYYTVKVLKSCGTKTNIQAGYYSNDSRGAVREMLMDPTYNFPYGVYELEVTSGSIKQTHRYVVDKKEVTKVEIVFR